MNEAMADKIEKFFCDQCRNKTNHFIRGDHIKKLVDTSCVHLPSYLFEYVIAECCGCNNFSFIRRFMDLNSDNYIYDFDPDTGVERREFDWKDEIFPPINYRTLLNWHKKLDEKILSYVLLEVHDALNREATFLAAFGCRTLLERFVYLHSGTKVDHLAESLKKLKTDIVITEVEYNSLKLVKDAGDAAAHRAWSPEKDQLGTILDIIEGMIHRYIILKKKLKISG